MNPQQEDYCKKPLSFYYFFRPNLLFFVRICSGPKIISAKPARLHLNLRDTAADWTLQSPSQQTEAFTGFASTGSQGEALNAVFGSS
jgi:hypothetical protein